MANIIINNDPYINTDALENVVHYVIRESKTRGVIGGQGVLLDNPVWYMNLVKNHFCQNDGKQVQHLILSFDSYENYITLIEAYQIGYAVCELFPEYQLVFGFHQDSEHKHIHWAINPVNMLNGKKLIFGFKESFELRVKIAEVLKNYDIKCDLRMPCGMEL